ncbi:thiamine-phosphate kinase [Hyphomonas sp.]|uniref:thiamine-phosphate kinase n=1 Tax=Hyphomonas sp. TaxID=87 RepID=UPI003F6E8D22|tara:strand:- start:8107 stop:9048 length:942 start_codon:yes stop_codon:yes gene_type:complete
MAEKEWIARYFAPLAKGQGAAGLRDDVALLETAGSVAITVDAMVEGVHFLVTDPIDTVARKLVRTNVSDLLASGAEPAEALLTLGWPKARGEAEIAAFAAALGDELSAWGAQLIGGDTVASPHGLFLSLTLTGLCLADGPVRRTSARPGDSVWLTGCIGSAARGWEAVSGGGKGVDVDRSPNAYWLPELPPLATAAFIASHASAAMDVSDGLLIDAGSLAAASGVSLEIELGAVVFAGGADGEAEMLKLATWGDDYQVLFTASEAASASIAQEASEKGIQLARIGKISGGSGLSLILRGQSVNLPETLGFEHG